MDPDPNFLTGLRNADIASVNNPDLNLTGWDLDMNFSQTKLKYLF